VKGFDEDNVQDYDTSFVDAFFGEGARAADGRSHDWRLNAINNYVEIPVEKVPIHMVFIIHYTLISVIVWDTECSKKIVLSSTVGLHILKN